MPRTPSVTNTESRRAAIVAAMLPVMARHGYEKATIQAIAREAGLTPGLIHYHFKSKQEILVSLVAAIVEFARTRYESRSAASASPADRLRAYVQARLGLGTGAAPDMVAAWVMIGAEAVRQPEVRVLYEEAIAQELALLKQLLSACLAEKRRTTDSAPTLAAGLVALMEGAFQLSSAAANVMPAGYAADAAMAFAAHGIDAAPRRKA
ncbi:TetR/AcrR family transcriptional regulator [Piscinibacter sp. HJYY11]|uniref:TetR/AcrR family transcriptional regulator n=1 Tax=Piscinibacter sp. HJYY11 TaxID=2801333 RepID=UPI00191FE3D4|nr:TetR family transcriptional regulator [Piscinibacter sp. HJYY11]MBL0727100.1 TetR family transcriptional regulator [Piscinibacter sp. HJYY11]